MDAHAPGVAVHVHIFGTQQVDLPNVNLTMTVTSEDPAPAIARGIDPRIYFHAARLIRFTEALRTCRQPLVMSDADAIVTEDPRFLLTMPGEVALRVRPGRLEPWHHFSACLVRGTLHGLPYFECAAEIVRRLLTNAFWGLDQYALFAAYLRTRPQLTLLGPEVAGVENSARGTFWFTAGKEKLSLETDETPYAQLFRTYS
jgi:hypothetical protein